MTVALLSADRAVIMWSSVPAAGLYGRRRMAVVWSAIVTMLCASNLHFFWTAQLTSASSVIAGTNRESSQSGLDVADDHITSTFQATTVRSNYSAPQTTSDALFLSTSSQSVFSFSSYLFSFPEKLAVLETSKFSTATVNPVEMSGLLTPSALASRWATSGDAEYCLIEPRFIRFFLGVWYWIDLTLWAIAPFVTIIFILAIYFLSAHWLFIVEVFVVACSLSFFRHDRRQQRRHRRATDAL